MTEKKANGLTLHGQEVGGLAEPAYEALREQCVGILIEAERHFVCSMWMIGQAIIAAIGAGRPEYGGQVVHRLAGDLGVDHTHVYRSIQLYETYPKGKIFDESSTICRLSWGKVRMLLPLPPDLRVEMEKRLAAGELRTDEDLRWAIQRRKVELGLIDMDFTPPQELGVKGIDAEKARTLMTKIRDGATLGVVVSTWLQEWKRCRSRAASEEDRLLDKQGLLAIAAEARRLAEER